MTPFLELLIIEGVYHATTSWAIIGFLMAMYLRLLASNKVPKIELSIIEALLCLIISFVFICRKWTLHLNFELS